MCWTHSTCGMAQGTVILAFARYFRRAAFQWLIS